MSDYIEIKNARVNNLKGISVNIPRDRLVVITGVSGSGKSSLAFDTLYAEGQRRYVESLSSYARQFLGRMSKPECDYIKGLPPAIAIEQKVIARNPRSTVGTSTEIYDYLRLLYARIGRTFSPVSGVEVKRHTLNDIINCTRQYGAGTRFMVLAPIVIPTDRTPEQQLQALRQQGYTKLWSNGEVIDIEEAECRGADDHNSFFILISRLSVSNSHESISRLTDAVETAYYEGHGRCRLVFVPANIVYDFSNAFEADGITFEEPSDRLFSFNSPSGACPTCEGFGKVMGIDERLVILNSSLSVYEGCVQCWHGEKLSIWQREFCQRAAADDFPIFEPYYALSQKHKDMLWHGLPSESRLPLKERACIDSFFAMVQDNLYKIQYRVLLSRYRGKTLCPDCHGRRLRAEAEYVRIGGKTITDLVEMPIHSLKSWFDNLQLDDNDRHIAGRILTEISTRLQFLLDVGLDYLTLSRPSNTLSGGESQRINLTTSLGSSLVGSLYVLDEPSIGLHSRDTDRLIRVLKNLRDIGNTVIVVEHDEEIMRAADHIIDIGPDAGQHGGQVVFAGRPECGDVGTPLHSHTLAYLTGQDSIDVPLSRRRWNMSITVKGARMNNLRGIDVTFPLNVLCVVTGVSGSGKSSLVKGILYPALKRRLDEMADLPGEHTAIEGDVSHIAHIELVDQQPIGKSTRSNAVTYLKVYDDIRRLMADQPAAKAMGLSAQYFSFNAEGGRCEECQGTGVVTVEMQFMADLELVCEECHGQRFKRDVLDVRFAGRNIHDILEMTVSEAIDFFNSNGQPAIARGLQPLDDVGLGYIKLGQSSATLSGGENQRVKLAYFIGRGGQKPSLFIFDEPTTGLHFHDIRRLLRAFDMLIDRGHSIIVIEHNQEVIKCADHIIDLGPEGGERGGAIIACGTPEQVVEQGKGYTAKYLSAKLGRYSANDPHVRLHTAKVLNDAK